jgi:tricorn protease
MVRGLAAAIVLIVGLAGNAAAGIDARMLRYPDVSDTQIAFVYAGDIWTVAKAGGLATHLSSPKGEESFPRFSPDGATIAFSGNYDGNSDVYTIPASGGTALRVTHSQAPDRMVDWYPDGKHLLIASGQGSPSNRFRAFFKVGSKGGLPQKLPLPHAEFGSLSADGEKLAFQMISRDFRTWKRYRGGMAPDLWMLNLKTLASSKITDHDANDGQAMWHGDTIYFLSDRSEAMRNNIWAHDTKSGAKRQVTHFTDVDVRFPSIGPFDMVFEAAGRLYLMDLASEKYDEVKVEVVTDQSTLRPAAKDVGKRIATSNISPEGKRVVIEARGDVFTLPAEHGPIRNLTRTSGAAERYPAWSPDGKWIAYQSDQSGEYQLMIRSADGGGTARTLTDYKSGWRFPPFWSPDSKRIAYVDEKFVVQILDVATRKIAEVGKLRLHGPGALRGQQFTWSTDSRWLAFTRLSENWREVVMLHDTKNRKTTQVTSGFYNDWGAVFGADGDYLFYLSERGVNPTRSDVDDSWVYVNGTRIAAVRLRQDVTDMLVTEMLALRNDDEEEEKKEADEKKEDEKDAEKKKKKVVDIDLDGFEGRAELLPPKARRYRGLVAVSGKVLFVDEPRKGSSGEKASIDFYDIEDRETKTIIEDVGTSFRLSANGKKLLVSRKGQYAIVDVKEKQKFEDPIRTDELEMVIDPRAEWNQMFHDTWRQERDFFYDANMHGVDWPAMRKQYGELLKDAVTRWDVNFVIGEMIAELNASHSYRSGGDTEQSKSRNVGVLGADYVLENGRYRVDAIVRGGQWDALKSPLEKAGVKEGDYLLAINRVPIDVSQDPWAALGGLANKTIELTVNDKPSFDGAREVLVKTMGGDRQLRYLAWIEKNRAYVDKKTKGRVGYIYVPDTGTRGQNELVRQFLAYHNKDGLIYDERFNSGGQYPHRFIELMNRRRSGYGGRRHSGFYGIDNLARTGPQVMLINGWAGSGGDLFPHLFRDAKLGPLIGTRTWGGLIGYSGPPGLIDGGRITAPNAPFYGLDGKWMIEGYGVDPDIEVVEDPGLLARGQDPQLDRAIEEILKLLKEKPPVFVPPPPYDDRTKGPYRGQGSKR